MKVFSILIAVFVLASSAYGQILPTPGKSHGPLDPNKFIQTPVPPDLPVEPTKPTPVPVAPVVPVAPSKQAASAGDTCAAMRSRCTVRVSSSCRSNHSGT